MVSAETTSFHQGMMGAASTMQNMKMNFMQLAWAIDTSLSQPIIRFGQDIFDLARNFGVSMNQVIAVTSATTGEAAQLEAMARKLGMETRYTAIQAAEGMQFLAMAGFDVQTVLRTIPEVLTLAAAGNLEMAQSADIVTNIMTAYGIESSQVGRAVDVLTKTFTSTNTNLIQLGNAFKYVGPVAHNAGLSFEEAAAAIGIMGNNGIQASMAGTSLRGAITRMLSPTKNVIEVMERYGLTFTDASGQLLGFADILEQLGTKSVTTGDMMKMFGLRAGPAMLALVEVGAGALRDLTTELNNAGGTAQRIADIQMQGLPGAIWRLESAWEGLKLTIADAGFTDAIIAIANIMLSLVKQLNDADPAVRKFIIAIGIAVAALGPMLVGVALLTIILGGILNPLGLIIAAVSAVIVILATFMLTSETLESDMADVWLRIQETIARATRVIKPYLEEFAAWAREAVPAAMSSALFWIETFFWWLENNGSSILDALATGFQMFSDVLSWVFLNVVVPVFNEVKAIVTAIADYIVLHWGAISTYVELVWSKIKQIVVDAAINIYNIWVEYGPIIVEAIQLVFEMAGSFLAVFVNIAMTAYQVFSDNVFAMAKTLGDNLSTLFLAVKAFWDTWGETILIVLEKIVVGGMLIMDTFGTVIQTGFSTFFTVVIGFLSAILYFLAGDWETGWAIMEVNLSLIWDGIKVLLKLALDGLLAMLGSWLAWLIDNWQLVWGKVSKIFSGVWNVLSDLLVDYMDRMKTGLETWWDNVKHMAIATVQELVNAVYALLNNSIAVINAWIVGVIVAVNLLRSVAGWGAFNPGDFVIAPLVPPQFGGNGGNEKGSSPPESRIYRNTAETRGAGTTISVVVNNAGTVTSERDLVQSIRRGLMQIGRDNLNLGISA